MDIDGGRKIEFIPHKIALFHKIKHVSLRLLVIETKLSAYFHLSMCESFFCVAIEGVLVGVVASLFMILPLPFNYISCCFTRCAKEWWRFTLSHLKGMWYH